MKNAHTGQTVIRKATEEDARQIAEILVEDWKIAYRGIIDSDYLDAMNAEQRYQTEVRRYQIFTVAADGKEVLGFAWNQTIDDEAPDCEIVALYVRYAKRNSGIGKALFLDAVDAFRASGRKCMIVWCLRENHEARKFYERMGGEVYKTGTHRWGNREYEMISYLYRLDGRPGDAHSQG
ncbi:MAG: GNAT family N-acetyltransferase [Clostridia bacterium]|nr:GNAT family N-acetyltransferase [Clostridia bacterium]